MATDKATILANFIQLSINNVVELGGSLVDDAEFERRVLICNGCEFQKDITVAKIEMGGCSICGCPTLTKPRFDEYFSLTKLKKIKAVCPHKNGDKWAIAADILTGKQT